MLAPIPINLAVEDALSEAVLQKILHQSGLPYAVGICYKKSGFGYLKKTIRGFNKVAKGTPFLVLTDLDKAECPPVLIQEWLPVHKHPNLLFRVAVRAVEAWILADRTGLAKFLGISEKLLPDDVDGLEDPKQCLINLAKKSRRRELRQDIVPLPGSTARQGPNYNGRLISFVKEFWEPHTGKRNSGSLQRTVTTVEKFRPQW